MRAGLYAVHGGTTYQAVSVAQIDDVRLVIAAGAPAPAGFEPDPRRDDLVFRDVPKSELSSLFLVAASAYFLDVFPVVVQAMRGADVAVVTYRPDGFPAPPPVDATGRFREPPLPVDHGVGWSGPVSVDELTGVVEVVQELPLEPVERWPVPQAPPLPPPDDGGSARRRAGGRPGRRRR